MAKRKSVEPKSAELFYAPVEAKKQWISDLHFAAEAVTQDGRVLGAGYYNHLEGAIEFAKRLKVLYSYDDTIQVICYDRRDRTNE